MDHRLDDLPFAASGDRRALDDLFCATYEQLRRLASAIRRDHPGATLTPTALVNEAWLKLAESPHFVTVPRLHFKRIAARAMRQVLIEAARRRHASKRGGRDGGRRSRSTSRWISRSTRARACSPSTRPSRTWRGFTLARRTSSRPASSAASASAKRQLLEVSEATILRDWRVARAWLAREVRRDRVSPW